MSDVNNEKLVIILPSPENAVFISVTEALNKLRISARNVHVFFLYEYANEKGEVAHVGRAYTKEDIGNAFDRLTQTPDTMYDFAANCCDYAIEEVIKRCGVKHVMFGTDMPILRMRTHRIEENGTYVNLVPPGLYYDPLGDPHLREVSEEEGEKITFFAYEELLAFKRVSEKLVLSRQDIEDIMYNNAMGLINGSKKDIYGI